MQIYHLSPQQHVQTFQNMSMAKLSILQHVDRMGTEGAHPTKVPKSRVPDSFAVRDVHRGWRSRVAPILSAAAADHCDQPQ